MPKTKNSATEEIGVVEKPVDILRAAKHAKPNLAKFAKANRRTEAAVRADTFEFRRSHSSVDGVTIHYFRTPGDTITGVLGSPNYEIWQQMSFPFILDDGTMIRLPGNRMLAKLIKEADCIHQRVTIEYLGKLWKTSRHYEKAYRISPAPYHSEGSIGKSVSAPAAKAKRRRAK